jgi:hypothetical protein
MNFTLAWRPNAAILGCMTTARLAVLAIAATALISGCGGTAGGGDEVAANQAFRQAAQREAAKTQRLMSQPAVRVVHDSYLAESRGQFGRSWDSLHPAHQAIVTRGRFEECMRRRNLPAVDELNVLDSYPDRITVRGIPEHQAAAVTLKAVTTQGEATFTSHAVKVAGRWRWILSNDAVRSFERGRCGS